MSAAKTNQGGTRARCQSQQTCSHGDAFAHIFRLEALYRKPPPNRRQCLEKVVSKASSYGFHPQKRIKSQPGQFLRLYSTGIRLP